MSESAIFVVRCASLPGTVLSSSLSLRAKTPLFSGREREGMILTEYDVDGFVLERKETRRYLQVGT